LAERYAAHPLASLETYKFFNQSGESAAAAQTDFIDAAYGRRDRLMRQPLITQISMLMSF